MACWVGHWRRAECVCGGNETGGRRERSFTRQARFVLMLLCSCCPESKDKQQDSKIMSREDDVKLVPLLERRGEREDTLRPAEPSTTVQ